MSMRFDFALSFAGADRATARKLHAALAAEGFRVFFDEAFEHEMLGQDGINYLANIYSRESRHCVVLISPAYDGSQWTNLERECIQARELTGERGILIPVRLTPHAPAWLPASRIYFDLSSRPLADLLKLLRAKHLSSMSGLPPQSPDSLVDTQVNLTGTWVSDENIGNFVTRVGIMSIAQSGEAISGNALLEERHPNADRIKFELELHGNVSLREQAVRFVGALVRVVAGNSAWPYSVDSFAGRMIDKDTIVGTCVDERGIRGNLRLTRRPGLA